MLQLCLQLCLFLLQHWLEIEENKIIKKDILNSNLVIVTYIVKNMFQESLLILDM